MIARCSLRSLAALGLLALATSAPAAVSISLVPDQTSYLVGATVTVKVEMGASATEVWGGQFFLTYSSADLAFVSATTGEAPFTQQVYSAASSPNVDYAVGAANNTVNGATTPKTMAVLKFTAINPIASTAGLVSFRPHSPPSRLTDNGAVEIASTTSDLPAISIAAWSGTDAWVDDNYVGLPNGYVVNWPHDGNPGPHAIGVDAFATIQGGVDAVSNSGTVHVASGSYTDVTVSGRTGLTIEGAGAATTTIVGSHLVGGYTVLVTSSPATTLHGFTITRNGNNPTDWASNAKSGGLNVSGSNGSLVRDNIITGNRNGFYMENNDSVTVRDNVIDNNRTGLHLVAVNTNCTITENAITNSWTMGVLFRTESVSNDTTGTKFVGNDISGNWYAQIEYREGFTAMPKDFSGNWLGTTSPTSSAVSGGEPGYAGQIPVIFGGTAVPPLPGPPDNVYDVKGDASAQFDITPMLTSGSDTDLGTFGFQGDFSHLIATTQLAQTGATGRVQEGVDLLADGVLTGPNRVVDVRAGSYVETFLGITKALKLLGPNVGIDPNTGSRVAEAILLPGTSDPDPNSPTSGAMVYLSVGSVTIDGLTIDGDNPALISGDVANGADLDAIEGIASYEGVGNITIQNNVVRNTSYTGIDLYNYVNDAATNGNTISHNLLSNLGDSVYNWGIGILVYNNFYADVSDNVIQDVRVGIQTGNFYRANPGMPASISDNTIATRRVGVFHNLHYSAASPFTIASNGISAVDDPSGTKWVGIMVSSLQTAVNATVQGNTINGAGTSVAQTTGYMAWNLPTSANVTATGGTVGGVHYGVWVNNFEGYASNADTTRFTVNNVQITADQIGVYVLDSPSNTNGSSVYAVVTGNTSIGGAASGVKVEGADAGATVIANSMSITGNAVGVLVDAGKALIENNDLTGNSFAGIRVQGGATVDAGDCSGSNVTGLGTGSGAAGSSAGNNTLTGYGYDDAMPWAVYNANTSAQPGVYAQNNAYGASAQSIGLLIFDSDDNAANSTVHYSQSGGQGISAAVAVNDYCNYAVPSSVTFTATYAGPGTVEWRDATCNGSLIGSGNPYVWNTPPSAPGTHTYYARLVNDGCSVECASTTIAVHAAPVITANVDLIGAVAGPFTRCITFDFFTSPTCPNPTFSHEETVTFTGGSGTAVFTAPCGTYTCVTARDRLHTLRRTIDLGNWHPSGNDYTVDFTTTDALLGGNVNDDNFIDILDFGGFIGRYGMPDLASTTCSTTGIHPDFDGDGSVGTTDFNSISLYFLTPREPDCCSNPLAEGQPTLEIAVLDLARTDYPAARTADLNRDGVLNAADVAFLGQHGFARCPADFYPDGSLDVQDIFIFLNNWFAGYPAADTNNDHAVRVDDIFDFINLWFQGC